MINCLFYKISENNKNRPSQFPVRHQMSYFVQTTIQTQTYLIYNDVKQAK